MIVVFPKYSVSSLEYRSTHGVRIFVDLLVGGDTLCPYFYYGHSKTDVRLLSCTTELELAPNFSFSDF